MYQVFDSELFGLAPPPLPPLPPLPPVDDDYTLQRYRDPGDGFDDVLGFLGLGLPSHAEGRAEDPGGGWVWLGDGAARRRGAFGGQLMETDEYVDYNCFSSGLTSPDLDSEFFVNAIPPYSLEGPVDPKIDSGYQDPWEFSPISSSGLLSCLSDRPHSPLRFHLETDCRLPGRAFPRAQFDCSHGIEGEFDSDAEEKVKEIARYLASFEVQSNSDDHQMVSNSMTNGTFPFRNTTSMIDQMKSTATAKAVCGSMTVFHQGYDDTCCGLEGTMVNPNEVFPDRIDRSDHQYASRPYQGPNAPSRASTNPHPQRTPPGATTTARVGGVSVLEALLRSNEPIDPNKGSGAAIGLDTPDQQTSRLCDLDTSHKVTEYDGVLKKLLTGRLKDATALSPHSTGGGGRRQETAGGATDDHNSFSASPTTASVTGSFTGGVNIGSGQAFGFIDQKTSTDITEQMELNDSIRDQDALVARGVTSRNRPSELLRFL